ncbi:hypothetical protein DPMN_152652 [Dreissena polymorpha]|uniref:U2A'/phosphoprotein 32 family A C-terminal domain-containing protein n=1 Tax=Dreissena polymorpha TaxID=45954 RepID=A0A9D4FJY4_DREPO|nr:hypothetical protein DPMN_152652 [Dreissena polymorpha]
MSQSLSSLTHLDTLNIKVNNDSPGLWDALRGLNIKSLSLNVAYGGLNVNYADSMSQSLSSLTQLDTLNIKVNNDSPGLWDALRGLNIKSLSLNVAYGGFNVNYADSMSQSLSSLTQLDTLNIKVNNDIPGLWDALRGLNIKSLSLNVAYGGFNVNYADSMSQSLSSLTQLDTLNIKVNNDIPGLWDALRGLNIKSLSLNVAYGGLNVNYADSMSQSLSSLTHLDTLSIQVDDDSPGLWDALRGLNIKSLSLNVAYGGLNVNYADSMSQSLSSLTHLVTLNIKVNNDSPGMWDALRGLNIKSLSLNAAYGGLNVNYADSMSQSLSSLTQLDTLNIKVNNDSPGLWDALRGLNIRSLSLNVAYGGLNVNYAESMSQSLSSLTHLDTLSIKVDDDSPGLWKALHGLNIKGVSLSGQYGGLNVNCADSMSQSLSSLTHLNTLSIEAKDFSFGLWEAIRGLSIKSLNLSGSFGWLREKQADSMSQSLSSLTHLVTLSIKVNNYSLGLWKALHELNIKSLNVGYGGLNVKYADSMSESLSSLTQLDTLSIGVDDYSPYLWQALYGLNIKSLSLSGQFEGFSVNYADSMSQSLSSLTHLDTLSIGVYDYSPVLWEVLRGLNIKSLSLSGGYMYRGLKVNYADSMSQSLSSLTQLDTLCIKVDDDSPGLWDALRGLNIKSLSLNVAYGGLNVNYADSMSQSLSSLTQLDTLNIKVNNISPGLWKALRGLNIKSLSLSGGYGGLNIDYADSVSLSLSSLTYLDKLSIEVNHDSPGLWAAIRGLNIKSLSLSVEFVGLNIDYADSMSLSLSSLTHLDTLSICTDGESPGLWKALHGLNINSLSISDRLFTVCHADSIAQSLSTLKQLETLSIYFYLYISTLSYLNH